MDDKSFMENAKGFMGAWKNDYAQKNKDILERSKTRKEEAKKMHEEFLKDLSEFGGELEGTAKNIMDTLIKNFNGFSEALKDGTATINDKLELEKNFKQLAVFLESTGKTSVQKFKELSASLSAKLKTFDEEIVSERIEAEKVLPKEQNTKSEIGSGIDELTEKVKNLFKDNL